MTRTAPFAAVLAVLVALGSTACASQTTLSDVWVADGVVKGQYKKIVVIGISPDQGRRMAFEDAFAKRIVGAVPSHSIMPLSDLSDRAKVQQKLKDAGFDGAIVIRMVGIEQSQTTMPGHATMLSPNTGNLYGYWDPSQSAFDRDLVLTTLSVALEVQFFDVATAERKFRAQSSSYNPDEQSGLADSLFDALHSELRKRGLL
jgi:hypothetical protein